jgi:hypothetical protein
MFGFNKRKTKEKKQRSYAFLYDSFSLSSSVLLLLKPIPGYRMFGFNKRRTEKER